MSSPASIERLGTTRRAVRFGGFARIIAASLLIALASCGSKDKPIPAESKARSEFLSVAAAKLTTPERDLLARFLARLDAQSAAGGAPSQVSVPRALELQRTYETQVADAQHSYQKLIEAANSDLVIDVRDATVVKGDKSRPVGEKHLRYVINVNNRGQRTIEQFAVRVEIRDESGKYQAAIPNLELSGSLRPGDSGRSVQTLALDSQRHQYILDGKPLQISAYPTRIAYVGGENIEPGKDLQTMESLHRAKIE